MELDGNLTQIIWQKRDERGKDVEAGHIKGLQGVHFVSLRQAVILNMGFVYSIRLLIHLVLKVSSNMNM